MGIARSARRVLALAAFQALACGGNDPALASVGGSRVEIEAYQAYIEEVSGEPWQGVGARVASGLLDQFLDRRVVLESAKRREVTTGTEPQSLGPGEMRWLMDELCGPPPEASAEAVDREVERRLGEDLPAQAHVRQVLVDSLEEAETARRRLASGDDFVTVSRELSRAPNAMDGGELGFFYEGNLPEEIDEVVFSLESGEISDPVQGPSGYHVIQVLEVIPAGPPATADVESAVRTELAEQGAREHMRECVGRLAAEVGVAVNSSNLWFRYEGKYAEDRGDA